MERKCQEKEKKQNAQFHSFDDVRGVQGLEIVAVIVKTQWEGQHTERNGQARYRFGNDSFPGTGNGPASTVISKYAIGEKSY